MSGRGLVALLATVLIASSFSAGAAARNEGDGFLAESEYRVVLAAASAIKKCPGAESNASASMEGRKRMISLGISTEIKDRFLAVLSPWSADRARFVALDPSRPEDVGKMFELLQGDSSHPGTMLDPRIWSTQVVLFAYYNAMAAGECEPSVEFRALLPRLRSDAWAPLAGGEFDLVAVQRDIDRTYDCFWMAVPEQDRTSPEAVRDFVAKGDIDELRQDAYEFAVNLETPQDRDRAAKYMVSAPTSGVRKEEVHFFMGLFLADQRQWSTLPDQVRAAALGTHHMAKAAPACRLGSDTLALIGKRQRH